MGDMKSTRDGFAPCPLCHQYSHSLGDDAVTAAFNHFQSMVAHPVRGHPMGNAFDEKTRDAAQVLMSVGFPTHLIERVERLEEALRQIDGGTTNAAMFFKERMGNRKSPTWWAVNVLQDYLLAAQGTARSVLSTREA